jgi:TonB-dependent receptor
VARWSEGATCVVIPTVGQAASLPERKGRLAACPTLLRLLALCVFIGLSLSMHAQEATGSVGGLVVSTWDGRPLPGVAVVVRGTTLAAQTDALGRYELKAVPPGYQVLRFSKGGYASATVTEVRVLPGQSTTVNGNLRPEFFELDEFEVTAEEFNEQTAEIIFERQQSASLVDAVGSEQFSKLGASDAADIVGKLPGITVTDGKNPIVRGLNERYVGITLNGAEVPSADPYRKSVQLDLFPAGLIEQVVVAKSFTPDLPGNSTGGGINVITKSFPEKFMFTLSVGVEYNTQTSLKNDEFLSYQGGATDWLAMDDGTRELPPELLDTLPLLVTTTARPNLPQFPQQVANAARLQELTVALGPTEFGPTQETAPLNHNVNFSFGDTLQLLGRRLGYFAGMQYRHGYQTTEGIANRFVPSGVPGELVQRRGFADTRSVQEINWAAIVNLAYEFSEGQEIAFNFLFNQNAEDLARQQAGFDTDSSNYLPFYQNRLIWTERNLTTYQLRGSHEFPQLGDLEVDWLAALSTTTQDEPDARFFNYAQSGADFYADGNFLPTPNQPTRYFRELEENNFNLKLDVKKPFEQWSGLEGYVKVGGYDSESERSFADREFYYQPQSSPGGYGPSSTFPFNGDPNAFFPAGSLVPGVRTNSNGSLRYTWHRVLQGRESVYDAEQAIRAGYAMFELPLVEKLRLMGGVRMESTDMDVLSAGALRSSVTGQQTNQATIGQTDWLPAVSLTYTPITNMNVRASFSQTVARPSFRELAAYRQYDPVLNELLEGNPALQMSAIDNYDLRWEWFPEPGAVLSVSLFYKMLANAIERQFITVDGEIISFVNRAEAGVRGVEFEARHGLGFLGEPLADFSVGMNAAYIDSEVKLTPGEISNRVQFLGDASDTRPLYDQSPYIINADFTWDQRDWGTTATVVFSVFGPRITIAGLATPDIYEQPAPQLDFILSQRLGEHFKLRFTARNLLNPEYDRTYGEEADAPLFQSFKRGVSLGLSVSYDF